MKRNQAKELVRELILEISAETFKSAIGASKERGTYKRTWRLGDTYFRQFKGKPLLDGTINRVTVDNQRAYDTPTVVIEVTGVPDERPGIEKTVYIAYDIEQDTYDIENTPISRKDANTLWKIAQHINPDTKYKLPGKTFKIIGDQ